MVGIFQYASINGVVAAWLTPGVITVRNQRPDASAFSAVNQRVPPTHSSCLSHQVPPLQTCKFFVLLQWEQQ